MSNTENEISMQGGNAGNVNLIYILYLVSIAVGVTGLVGLVMAYIGKDGADELTTSHYNNQINIFWKTLLFSVISFVTMFILIGFLLMIATLVWYIIRVVKGMQALGRNEPIANPGSWGF